MSLCVTTFCLWYFYSRSLTSGVSEVTRPKYHVVHRLPFITELHRSQGTSLRRRQSRDVLVPFPNAQCSSTEFPLQKSMSVEDADCKPNSGMLKTGNLSKTTLARREGAKKGPTRHRQFRLTEVALEYFHLFSHVSLRHNNSVLSQSLLLCMVSILILCFEGKSKA